MIKRAVFIWVTGLVTIVPYGIYYLLFEAPREEYAFLITGVLFWIFGYWGVVAPLISAIKVRKLFKAIENAQSGDQLRKLIKRNESREAIIELIASENHVPKFIANRIYNLALKRFSASNSPSQKNDII